MPFIQITIAQGHDAATALLISPGLTTGLRAMTVAAAAAKTVSARPREILVVAMCFPVSYEVTLT